MNTQYAGFGHRLGAFLIDVVILWIVQFIVVTPVLGVLGLGMANEIENFQPGDEAAAVGMVGAIMAAAGLIWLVTTALLVLYYAIMESSKYQGTLGKLAVGIKVTDLNGSPVGFGKALGRSLGRILSYMFMFIGFIIAAFTEKKQALHDLMAGTLVLKK